MRVTTVTRKNILNGQSCLQCNRPIKTGEVVMTHRSQVGRLYHHFTVHADCARKMLGMKTTKEEDEILAFQNLKTKILTSGQLFPED